MALLWRSCGRKRIGPDLGRQTQSNLGHISAVYLGQMCAKGNLLTGLFNNYNRAFIKQQRKTSIIDKLIIL
ncbi:hypothetical protein, partial [Cetobacterium sp.]|uniref:hypothetical protein n=1 Tax=Cetobacterium sp. TaxID=2071632 RepID=UPI003EE5CB87